LQRIREEVFRAIEIIYIELLASRPPPAFQGSGESFEKKRNIEKEIFEVPQCVATMGRRI
jgi:hypothetical protein